MLSVVFALLISWCMISETCGQSNKNDKDQVNNLPGLTYKHSYKQYAGYLNASDGMNIFFWFIESQSSTPSKDPIIVWLSPYPGCSSLVGLLKEIGPFRPNVDGSTLFENVFSWNKLANLLFIDTPSGTGWSYTTSPKPPMPTDDTVAKHNFEALQSFFNTKFSSYQNNDLYIAGETYGGVYVPTVAKLIADAATKRTFPNILKGIAIGNGILSVETQFNAMIHFTYNHGLIGTDTWDELRSKCSCSSGPEENCGFYSAVNTNPNGDCAKAVNPIIAMIQSNTTIDASNIFRDCYTDSSPKKSTLDSDMYLDSIGYFPPSSSHKTDSKTASKDAPWSAYDPAHNTDYDSTDALLGFTCWGDESKYLSQKSVMSALHVASNFNGKSFVSCANPEIAYNRSNAYTKMDTTISYLLQKTSVKILFYNGDLDLEYNFLGLEWFIDRHLFKEMSDLKLKVVENRLPWTYRGQTAGFSKRYVNMDEVVVKGSGRYVGMDRGGPALQMISNFLHNKPYSTATNIVLTPKANIASFLFGEIPFMALWVELCLVFTGMVVLSKL